ncbi:MAG: LCP family protein, partial [Anaerolineales bacterium]|nr:LCP family protein [Anaerolineales bacterium]MDW8447964.1 LCP family protein [Anaerolineales bacterium]
MKKPGHPLLLFLLSFLIFAGCTLPDLALLVPFVESPAWQEMPAEQVEKNSVYVTATPTPFQPLPPTPVITPTEIPTWTPEPSATLLPPPETPAPLPPANPAPAEAVVNLPKRLNILLLGSDRRPGGSLFRTDTIILVSIDTQKGRVHILSFPRDLYVYIPGWTQDRINVAWQHGGFEGLAATMEHNFGVRPTHYALINFRSFKRIVDDLGGLEVKVGQPLYDKYPGK